MEYDVKKDFSAYHFYTSFLDFFRSITLFYYYSLYTLQSLESMLAERVEVFKRKEEERIAEEKQAQITHKQMTSELKKCLMEKHRKFLDEQTIVHNQHRDQSVSNRTIIMQNTQKW